MNGNRLYQKDKERARSLVRFISDVKKEHTLPKGCIEVITFAAINYELESYCRNKLEKADKRIFDYSIMRE